MYKSILISLAFLALATSALGQGVKALLKAADNYRLPETSMRMDIQVDLFKSGTLDRQQEYTVYVKDGRRSLVIFRQADQLGQKVLMVADNFWILMPKSRQPIRITPMQKLMGDATIGDISTMTWSEDYDGALVGPERLDDKQTLHLKLQAVTPSATYKEIDLYLDEKHHSPIQADLYLASGKLAKIARFKFGQRNNRQQVVEMQLEDAIQKNRMTVVRYVSAEPREIPDKYYNAGYLILSGTGELR